MSEQESRAFTVDTSTSPTVAGGLPGRAGDLAPGTVLEREVIDVTAVGDTWRRLEPGAVTIKAGS